MKKLFVSLCLIFLGFSLYAQDELKINPKDENSKSIFQFTPYFSIGYLIVSPSWEDLEFGDYGSGWGSDVKNDNEMTCFNYSFGLQVLSSMLGNSIKIGIDLGWRKLFSYQFILHNYFYNTVAKWDGYENSIFAFGIIDYSLLKELFIQAGIGIHRVNWYDKYEFTASKTKEYSDSKINFAFMLAGDIKIPISKNIEIPVKVRFDFIKRYDMLINLSASTGFSFIL